MPVLIACIAHPPNSDKFGRADAINPAIDMTNWCHPLLNHACSLPSPPPIFLAVLATLEKSEE
jgi:hypothetical protein